MPKSLVSIDGIALNKRNICIAKTSPPEVQKAYYAQFKSDFTLFLESRAREIVPGGSMVLTFLGSIQSTDPHSLHELLGFTLHDMASEVTSKYQSINASISSKETTSEPPPPKKKVIVECGYVGMLSI